jgi:hypothetical protein
MVTFKAGLLFLLPALTGAVDVDMKTALMMRLVSILASKCLKHKFPPVLL